MTQEEYKLLVRALCEYLPYNVICETEDGRGTLVSVEPISDLVYVQFCLNADAEEYEIWGGTVKPYLRPMESLTKEERIEIGKVIQKDRINPSGEIKEAGSDNLLLCTVRQSTNLLSWMNANYIDYRGLIPMGLALEAPFGMYK